MDGVRGAGLGRRMTSDLARLRSLRATLDEMLRPGFSQDDEAVVAACRADIEAIEQDWPDQRLIDAHREGEGAPGDLEVDAVLAEIRRRDLDV